MIDTPPNLTSIIIAIVTAILGPILVFWITKLIERKAKLTTRKNHIKAYEENKELSEILEEISTLPGVRKAVFIKNTNGGGIPKLGNAIYSSILSPSRWSATWNHQLIDQQFASLTLGLLRKGRKFIETSQLEVNSTLYNLLISQGVVCSYWEEISLTSKSYNFVAIDFYIEESKITEEVKNILRIQVNEIRNLYKNSETSNL